MSKRDDGRLDDELRPVVITRGFTEHPAGSVLIEFGHTKVMCTASVTDGVPRWRKGSGLGWLTAEYAMLPSATHTRVLIIPKPVYHRLDSRRRPITRMSVNRGIHLDRATARGHPAMGGHIRPCRRWVGYRR